MANSESFLCVRSLFLSPFVDLTRSCWLLTRRQYVSWGRGMWNSVVSTSPCVRVGMYALCAGSTVIHSSIHDVTPSKDYRGGWVIPSPLVLQERTVSYSNLLRLLATYRGQFMRLDNLLLVVPTHQTTTASDRHRRRVENNSKDHKKVSRTILTNTHPFAMLYCYLEVVIGN